MFLYTGMFFVMYCFIDYLKLKLKSNKIERIQMIKGQKAGDGPIAVEVEKDKSYYWCSCGKSKNQPFCDGSHKDTEFTPVAYKAEETKVVYFCACKQTNNQPFCDGSHSK